MKDEKEKMGFGSNKVCLGGNMGSGCKGLRKRIFGGLTGKSAIIGMMVAMAGMMMGCGTNEENYKKAYDKAMENKGEEAESTIYTRVREMSREEKIVTGGDTVNVVVEYVTATEKAGFTASQLKKYNVVVGRFKQLFHAKSMRKRMDEGGYHGAIIVETGEPLYYVVLRSTTDLGEARGVADSVRVSSPVKLGDGFPMILRASNRR